MNEYELNILQSIGVVVAGTLSGYGQNIGIPSFSFWILLVWFWFFVKTELLMEECQNDGKLITNEAFQDCLWQFAIDIFEYTIGYSIVLLLNWAAFYITVWILFKCFLWL